MTDEERETQQAGFLDWSSGSRRSSSSQSALISSRLRRGDNPRSVRSAVKNWRHPRDSRPRRCARSSPQRTAGATDCSCASSGRRCRISEVLALRPMDVQRDSLVLPNRKNPNLTVKRVFLPDSELSLTGELLLWAKEQQVADKEALFFSRKRRTDGWRRAVQRPDRLTARAPAPQHQR
jgi:hypothetical protein